MSKCWPDKKKKLSARYNYKELFHSSASQMSDVQSPPGYLKIELTITITSTICVYYIDNSISKTPSCQ